MKKKFTAAVFTRTPWNEMPRIRHQLANLLAAYNHHVTFFEKAESISSGLPRRISEFLTVVPLPEVIHHQLRPFRQLGNAANSFPKKFISRYYSKINPPDVIINFNYDFGFLKDIFPDVP